MTASMMAELMELKRRLDWFERTEVLTTAYDDLLHEPTARTTGTNAPTFEKWFDDVTNSTRGVYLYSFDDALVASEKEIFFNLQVPHRVKVGSALYLHVHWVAATTAASSKVRWGLEFCWAEPSKAYSDTTTIYASTDIYSATATTQYQHTITEFAAQTPTTDQDGLSSIAICRLFRNSSHADDTYTGKVGLLYIDSHVVIDTLGSRSEYTK